MCLCVLGVVAMFQCVCKELWPCFCLCVSGAVAMFSVPSAPITHCRCHSSISISQSASVSTATAKHPHPPILLPLLQPSRRTPLTVAQSPSWALALRCRDATTTSVVSFHVLMLSAEH